MITAVIQRFEIGDNRGMGRLHPSNFNLLAMKESEARVVQALVEYTDSSWIIMPTGHVPHDPPVEIDIVVAHPGHGIGIIEVKGWTPRVSSGRWMYPDQTDAPDPVAQITRNRYALRDHLRRSIPELRHVHVEAAIAFVNSGGFKDSARPSDITEEQLIWSQDLETIDHSLLRFMNRGRRDVPMFETGLFGEVIKAIRPDVEFDPNPGAYVQWARERIEAYSGAQVRALERLDANRRVFVSGGAGTGKSRLALAWTRRASMRGERVLLVCFNEPLGAEFGRRIGDMEGVTVGAFLRRALTFAGIPALEEPANAGTDFWNNTVQGHLHLHWPDVEDRFDTIVIDEAQDFSPSWLAMLESLLDPDGPRRMLLTGDIDQELHSRGFSTPRSEDGWVVCDLSVNTRNSRGVARLLRNRLGGPPAPSSLPESTHLRFSPVRGLEEMTDLVRAEVEALLSAGFTHEGIAVACLDSTSRDALRQTSMFVPFEGAGESSVICETARRLKGLEFPAVILVSSRWPVDDTVLYVGVSRAVFGLSVFGPVELGDRLGLLTG